jgi:hypothetical protein
VTWLLSKHLALLGAGAALRSTLGLGFRSPHGSGNQSIISEGSGCAEVRDIDAMRLPPISSYIRFSGAISTLTALLAFLPLR